MRAKTTLAALLLLSATLLIGCNYRGIDSRTIRDAGDKFQHACEQSDEPAAARLEEDLRLANERAALAEERAELEKRKREFAEERLKQLEETNEGENLAAPAEEKPVRGS